MNFFLKDGSETGGITTITPVPQMPCAKGFEGGDGNMWGIFLKKIKIWHLVVWWLVLGLWKNLTSNFGCPGNGCFRNCLIIKVSGKCKDYFWRDVTSRVVKLLLVGDEDYSHAWRGLSSSSVKCIILNFIDICLAFVKPKRTVFVPCESRLRSLWEL